MLRQFTGHFTFSPCVLACEGTYDNCHAITSVLLWIILLLTQYRNLSKNRFFFLFSAVVFRYCVDFNRVAHLFLV